MLMAFVVGTTANNQVRPKERKLYVGKDSVEATMTYGGEVQIESEGKPSKKLSREKIEDQVMHLFGPMGVARHYAVPKGDHEIELTGEPEAVDEGIWVARYRYSGTIVVRVPSQKELPATYSITLPVNPDTIYDAGTVVTKSGKEKFPCTDEHYTGEGDFWYFWNPKQEGCPLVENTDYVKIAARVKGFKNTRITYPEYARLVDENGDIRITAFVGMDDPDTSARNPYESKDENAPTYTSVAKYLTDKGYVSHRWTRKEIEAVAPKHTPYPYIEEFTKQNEKANLRVRLFFGESGMDERSAAFHYFFRDSLENDSIMIYDGHSGLGGHLDILDIEKQEAIKIRLPKEKYQLYFFNSCSSYSYYNRAYFAQKATEEDPRGSKNLEILTNGLATYFAVMHDTDLELIRAVEAWSVGKASVSYQALAKKIDSGNLFGVNGDEDNPKRP